MSFFEKFFSQFRIGNLNFENNEKQTDASDIDSLCDAFYEKENKAELSNKTSLMISPNDHQILDDNIEKNSSHELKPNHLQSDLELKSIDSLSINSCSGNCGSESFQKENKCQDACSSRGDKMSFNNVESEFRSSLSTLGSKKQDKSIRSRQCGTQSSELSGCTSQMSLPYECDHAVKGESCVSEVSYDEEFFDELPHYTKSLLSQVCLQCELNAKKKQMTELWDRNKLISPVLPCHENQEMISYPEPPADDIIPFAIDANNISTCGTIDVALQFFLSEKKLQISVLEARDIPSKDRGGSSILQVRLVILPTKKKRFRTKVQHITSPKFAETFQIFKITPDSLQMLGLRIRLYGIGKIKDRLIGEASIRFDEVDLVRDPQLTLTLMLEPRADVNRGDMELLQGIEMDEDTVKTLTHGGSLPELLVSLSYTEMTGKLCVGVLKGSHFKNLAASKPPDTFVKVTLLNSTFQEIAHSKTSVRKNHPNPVYKESFYFQVASFQLNEVSLMISVYITKTVKRKEIFGWISMGKSNSSDFEHQHWKEMCDSPAGAAVNRWHALIDT